MAQHSTRKNSRSAKQETLHRRAVRRAKYGI